MELLTITHCLSLSLPPCFTSLFSFHFASSPANHLPEIMQISRFKNMLHREFTFTSFLLATLPSFPLSLTKNGSPQLHLEKRDFRRSDHSLLPSFFPHPPLLTVIEGWPDSEQGWRVWVSVFTFGVCVGECAPMLPQRTVEGGSGFWLTLASFVTLPPWTKLLQLCADQNIRDFLTSSSGTG